MAKLQFQLSTVNKEIVLITYWQNSDSRFLFSPYQENEDDWDRLYYYFVLKKNHVAQILHLSFVSLKEAAIRNCPHYAKILTYDAFVKLLKDIPVEDPLQDTDVNTLI